MKHKVNRYKTIVADPPWHYGSWSAPSNRKGQVYEMPYKTMTVQEICDMPVSIIADDDSQLFLWTTNKYLPNAFDVMEQWGFKYAQTLTWTKAPRGTGQGGLFTPTTEFILVGRRGKMPRKQRIDTTWFNWKRSHNSHSRKPIEANELIMSISDPPFIELFARSKFLDWHVWGNELENDINLYESTPEPNKEINHE